MNKKEMARLIKSQSEAIKALSEKHQTLENALNTILAKNPQLAGEPELAAEKPKALDQSVFYGQDEKYQWAMIGSNGKALLFDTKPIGATDSGWMFIVKPDALELQGLEFDATDWQSSLIEREMLSETEITEV